MSDIVERFNERWMPEPNSGCWLWLGSIFQCGPYGSNIRPRLGLPGKRSIMAHRLSWELYRGPIPPGLSVCHKCDVTLCVNPDHLWLGTTRENAADMVRKNRASKLFGVRNPFHRLDDDLVRWIRTSSLAHRAIGRKVGISEKTVRLVRNRQTWGHVI